MKATEAYWGREWERERAGGKRLKKEEKIELEKVREKRDRKRLRIFCFRHVLKTVSALQIDKKKEKKKKRDVHWDTTHRNLNASAHFLLEMQMNYSLSSLRLKQCFKLASVHMHEGERSNPKAGSSWNMFCIFRTTKQHIKKMWLDRNVVLSHGTATNVGTVLIKQINNTTKSPSWYVKINNKKIIK